MEYKQHYNNHQNGNTIKVAVIGAGNIGKKHMRVYNTLGSKYPLRLSFSNTSQEKVEETKEHMALAYGRHIASGHPNYQDLLKRERPDIVDICSPDYKHLENMQYVVENALLNGTKVINCEKPLVIPSQISECEKIVERIERDRIKSGTTLQLYSIPKQLENMVINGMTYSEIKKKWPCNINWITLNANGTNPDIDLLPHVLCILDEPIKSVDKVHKETRNAVYIINGVHRLALGYAYEKSRIIRSWNRGPYNFEYRVDVLEDKSVVASVMLRFNNQPANPKKKTLRDPMESYLESVINQNPLVSARQGLENARKTAEIASI